MFGQRKRRQNNTFKSPTEMRRQTTTATQVKSLQDAFRSVCFEERGYRPYMALDNSAIWMSAAEEFMKVQQKHPKVHAYAYVAFFICQAHFAYPILPQHLAAGGAGLRYEWEGEEWHKMRAIVLINQVRNVVEMLAVLRTPGEALAYCHDHQYTDICKYIVCMLLGADIEANRYHSAIARDQGRTDNLEAVVEKLLQKYKNVFKPTAKEPEIASKA